MDRAFMMAYEDLIAGSTLLSRTYKADALELFEDFEDHVLQSEHINHVQTSVLLDDMVYVRSLLSETEMIKALRDLERIRDNMLGLVD